MKNVTEEEFKEKTGEILDTVKYYDTVLITSPDENIVVMPYSEIIDKFGKPIFPMYNNRKTLKRSQSTNHDHPLSGWFDFRPIRA